MPARDDIPDLRLVRTGQVQFHEHPERHRTQRLVERLRAEAVLRNPPIVAGLDARRFLLLDGANRVSAFRDLGYSHVPVQVIDYGDPGVQLKGWHHLLLEGRRLALREAFQRLPGVVVRRVSGHGLQPLLDLRRVFAVLVDDRASCWGLFPSRGVFDVRRWIRVLDRIVATYEGRSRLERIKLADFSRLPRAFRAVQHQLVLFPTLTKVELLQLAGEGVMIPTGITRHLIPRRALGLNLELGFLAGGASEAARARALQRFVRELEMRGKIRFYEESVFIMNE